MPGLSYSYRDYVRLDLCIPFFMRDDPFDAQQLNPGSTYNWRSSKPLILIVKNRDRSPHNRHLIARNFGCLDSGLVGDTVSLGIGGNPLECPFDPNENFEEAEALRAPLPDLVLSPLDFSLKAYEGLDFESSRILTTMIQDKNEDVVKGLGLSTPTGFLGDSEPIYIAADDPTSQEIVLTGLQRETYFEVKVKGPFSYEPSSFDLEYFLALHNRSQSSLEVHNRKPVQKEVHVMYEIPYGLDYTDGRVFLEFVWSNPKDIFGTPPMNARSKLAIRPKPGDANAELKAFWAEICLLEKLIELRESDRNADNNKPYYHQHSNNSSVMDDESSVVGKIRDLVQHPSTPSWNMAKDYASPMNVVLQRVLEADRSDVDFTDKVWAILKDATNISDVFECFHEIFVNVEKGYWRPYLLPTNKTSFGEIVKELRGEELVNFRTLLTPNLALDMTIEFGILKLHRDYAFLFAIFQLSERSILLPFGPLLKNHRESILSIKKLHCVMEVICLAKERIGLLREDHQAFAHVVLKELEPQLSMDWDQIFHFDLNYEQLNSLLTGLKIMYWNLRLETVGPLVVKRTNFIFSRDCFVCLAKERMAKYDDTTGSRPWYLYIHRTAQRRQS